MTEGITGRALASQLEGHRAVVTGAGQGVGRGIALELAAGGAHVVVNDLSGERAEDVVVEIRDAGGSADAAAFDVTDHAAVAAALAGRGVDIVVNNAGNAGASSSMAMASFVDTSPSRLAAVSRRQPARRDALRPRRAAGR